MKDLQELFESLGHDEMTKLSTLMDKKNVNPKSVQKIINYIATVYCGEMGVESAEVDDDKMEELYRSFCLSASIYGNVLIGHMEIKSGRMMLTDGNSCSFALTPEGVKNVENNLL